MKRRIWLIVAALIALSALPAFADNQFIVRTKGGRTAIEQTCARLGCTVIRTLDGSRNRVFLIATSDTTRPDFFLELLEDAAGVEHAERVRSAVLPEAPRDQNLNQDSLAALNWLNETRLADYYGDTVWQGYVTQPAAQIIRIAEAQRISNNGGAGIIAVIDTGIDPNHPALKNSVTSGYDFIRDVSGLPSELADLNQSTVAVLNQSTVAVLNQSTVAVLNQSTVAVLNDPRFAAFGHGTMIAGIIHLVAPRAKIMPLRAFRPDGTAYTSDIARAIYYAVQNGANVINMSFSLPEFSSEVMRAVNFATRNGVVCVASVGNDGKDVLVFPAAHGNVIGVASTTDQDLRSSFSNFGADTVWVAAPGEGIITTFPGSSYAAAWGTSFSAAFVSGGAALLLDVDTKMNPIPTAEALAHAKFISEELGFGRLDLYEALLARRKALQLENTY